MSNNREWSQKVPAGEIVTLDDKIYSKIVLTKSEIIKNEKIDAKENSKCQIIAIVRELVTNKDNEDEFKDKEFIVTELELKAKESEKIKDLSFSFSDTVRFHNKGEYDILLKGYSEGELHDDEYDEVAEDVENSKIKDDSLQDEDPEVKALRKIAAGEQFTPEVAHARLALAYHLQGPRMIKDKKKNKWRFKHKKFVNKTE